MKGQGLAQPSSRVIRTIAAALREIEAHFELLGFSDPTAEVEVLTDAAAVPESEDEYDEEDLCDGEDVSLGPSVYEREEIEVAIDVFLSELAREKLIKNAAPLQKRSFSSVFQRFFGEDHSITKAAESFEERIEGYFGWVGYEDMQAAYFDLLEIRKLLKGEATKKLDRPT